MRMAEVRAHKGGGMSRALASVVAMVWLSMLIFIAGTSKSHACPPGQYSSFGMCLPEIGGSVGQAFEHGKKELEGQVGGPLLEKWIVESRNTAMSGAMPIPPMIRQELTGYASEDSMNRVRYKIGDSGFLNLAHLLEQGGFASAVTLIDVVVFQGPTEASDPAIWAHELVHVDQYRDWGVHGFAIRYARDYNAVEAPAYAKGNGYQNWAENQDRIMPDQTDGSDTAINPYPPIGTIQLPQPIPRPQFGAFCYTPFGRFGPGPMRPFTAPCFVSFPGRPPVWGTIGP